MYFHPLNFLRFVLALGVVLFHYGLSYYPFNTPHLKSFIEHSSFRVSFFFFISGFVMCLVYARHSSVISTLDFYKKRFTRIFPLYWLAFIITLLLVLFVNQSAPKGLVIILHFFGFQSLYPGYVLDLNFPTWSISVELFFYLIFPFILRWITNYSLTKLIFISTAIWLLQTIQHIFFVERLADGSKVIQEFIDSFPVWHLSTFFSGMITARIILSNTISKSFKKFSVVYFLLCILFLIYLTVAKNPILKYIHNGALSPVFALLLISLYYDRSGIQRLLSHKYLSQLGDLSFCLFIMQYPVWLVCSSLSGSVFLHSSFFFFIYLALLITISFIINHYYEKPAMNYLRKKLFGLSQG